MDKFSELLIELQTIIERLNKEIATTFDVAQELTQEREKASESKKTIEKRIEETEKNLEFLKHYEHKNITFTTIKDLWEVFSKGLFGSKKSKIISSIIGLILITASVIEPNFGIGISCIFAIYIGIVSLVMHYVVKTTRRNATIEELEDETATLEELLTKANAKINNIDKKIADNMSRKTTLVIERNRYLTDAKNVENSRLTILQSLVPESTLNSAFEQQDFTEVMSRVREKKRVDNGQI